MCGIAGVLELRGGNADLNALRAMIHALRHRGPDAIAFHRDGPLGLAHARLSIIDLPGGNQPMANEDGSVWITFNGEIFNYRELRVTLEAKGHRFSTQSDTEVLIHLYEEKGEACVHALNGQWAFAIWDARRSKLFLSRDRLGVRPLFYTQTADAFLFASEIKALFTRATVGHALDLQALAQLFTFWVTLPGRTLFKDVRELPPGHSLVVQHGKVCLHRYWQPDFPADIAPMDEDECAEQLLALLRDAVKLRLRADVPVSTYLSGGLDSTVVTALLRDTSAASLETFSVAFDDPEFDESAFQREAVAHLGTRHTEFRCSYEDIARVFPDVIRHTEKPLLRTAPAPMYLLAQQVHRAGGRVVMTGEGADEMLGGYDIFKEAKIRRFCAAYPDSKRRPLLFKRLYPYLPQLQAQPPAYLQAFFRARPKDLGSPFFSHIPRWDSAKQLDMLLSEGVRAELSGYDVLADLEAQLPSIYRRWEPMAQAQYLETLLLLPGYILSSQGDRVAMAHAVEMRFPFLDHRVVEFAAGIPARLKMKGLNEKYILKRATRQFVPPSIRARTKQPYRAPDIKSFIHEHTPDYVRQIMSSERVERDGIFDARAVQSLMRKAEQGRATGTRDNMAFVGVLSTGLMIEQMT